MSEAPISKGKRDELKARMIRLGIDEKDIVEKFIHGSGPGGQKINKTASAVYLKHIPTGIEIKCQRSRLRESNRFFARRELCERIEGKTICEESKKQMEIFKKRKQKARRSRKAKEKMLENKHKQSLKKKLRSRVDNDDNYLL